MQRLAVMASSSFRTFLLQVLSALPGASAMRRATYFSPQMPAPLPPLARAAPSVPRHLLQPDWHLVLAPHLVLVLELDQRSGLLPVLARHLVSAEARWRKQDRRLAQVVSLGLGQRQRSLPARLLVLGPHLALGSRPLCPPGTAAGIGAGAGVGAGLNRQAAAAPAVGAASAVGSGVGPGLGSSAGTGAAATVGAALVASPGASPGVGAASAPGAATTVAIGASSGTGTASGAGASASLAAGSAAGIGDVAAVGEGLRAASGVSAASGVASSIGASASWAPPQLRASAARPELVLALRPRLARRLVHRRLWQLRV
jgi:hypothetical protein